MDILEKARIRMESWIHHNDHHEEEYQSLADELEASGKPESSASIRRMAELMKQSNDYLREALKALE